MDDFEKYMGIYEKVQGELSLTLIMEDWREGVRKTAPAAREVSSNALQFNIRYLEALERIVVPRIDETMHQLNMPSLSKVSIEDFMEFREVVKQETYELKRAIDSLKGLLEIYDRLLFWANKEL